MVTGQRKMGGEKNQGENGEANFRYLFGNFGNGSGGHPGKALIIPAQDG